MMDRDAPGGAVGDRLAGRLFDLAEQVRRLHPEKGYDREVFRREMAGLGAEMEGLARGVLERLV